MQNWEEKDLCDKRRDEKDDRRNKGFTLAEMLVVVAIIAILVAIPIPVFTSRMEKAREASDISNMRSAKSAVIMEYLDGSIDFDGKGSAGPYYYNPSKGTLEENPEDALPAYGQGTERIDGGMEFDGYNETGPDGEVIGTEAKDRIIRITVREETRKSSSPDSGIIIEMEWVDP
ncbi:MAG: prepilin-type N-terminal cleavage/methylation domain-containing protein [Hungatella sp.]|nr:prepilin-type N-terminal cleavage/methylation domain-containing protein [Hungatella sp.]